MNLVDAYTKLAIWLSGCKRCNKTINEIEREPEFRKAWIDALSKNIDDTIALELKEQGYGEKEKK